MSGCAEERAGVCCRFFVFGSSRRLKRVAIGVRTVHVAMPSPALCQTLPFLPLAAT